MCSLKGPHLSPTARAVRAEGGPASCSREEFVAEANLGSSVYWVHKA